MATTNQGERSTSGKLRRAIGISRRVLAQRTEALRSAIEKTVGEEEFDHLSEAQCALIRELEDDELVDSFDFLTDARSEASSAHAKLLQQHLEFTSLARTSETERLALESYVERYGDYTKELENTHTVILLADIVLDVYVEVATEKRIDLTPLDENLSELDTTAAPPTAPSQSSSRMNPFFALTPTSVSKRQLPSTRIASSANAPPIPLRRSSIPQSNDPQQANAQIQSNPLLVQSQSANLQCNCSHPNQQSKPQCNNDQRQPPSIAVPVPRSRGFPISISLQPPPGLSPMPSDLPLPPPDFFYPTLYQQAAMTGRVQPPTFNGDVTEFAEFREAFESLFGSLDEVSKLAMLFSSLGPEPKRLISGLRRIDRNYRTAMVILANEYDDTHLIQHTLLSRIRTLPQCDEDGLRLRETYLTLTEVIRQLLPDDADDTSGILSNMVISKLPPSLQCRVFLDHPDKKQPIRVYEVLNILSREVEKERIEAAIKNRSDPFLSPPDPPPNDDTTSGISHRMRDTRPPPYCRLCQHTGHYPDYCSSYSSVRDRLTVVKQRNLCRRCFGANHTVSECRFSRLCRHCRGIHHTAICESPQANSSTPSPQSAQQSPQPISPSSPPNNTPKSKPTNANAKPTPSPKPSQYISNLAFDSLDPAPNYLRYGRDYRDDDSF